MPKLPSTKITKKSINSIRINAGTWRSRLIKFPDADGLRPTPERVRQTLFNWLGQDLTGFECLDLFAGTGIMGFESLSRGAKSATMVEKSHLAFKALQENKTTLNAIDARMFNQDALQFLADSINPVSFNLIFLDPPYHQQFIPKVLPLLPPFLAQNGLVYAEAEYEIKSSDHWQVLKQGKAGNVFYHLLKSSHVKITP